MDKTVLQNRKRTLEAELKKLEKTENDLTTDLEKQFLKTDEYKNLISFIKANKKRIFNLTIKTTLDYDAYDDDNMCFGWGEDELYDLFMKNNEYKMLRLENKVLYRKAEKKFAEIMNGDENDFGEFLDNRIS